MGQKEQIKLFEQKRVRSVWDEEKEEWFFSVIDVVEVLSDSTNPTDYLKKMRKRDPEIGIYIGTNCPQVVMTTRQYKQHKGLKKENLRDNMTKEAILGLKNFIVMNVVL